MSLMATEVWESEKHSLALGDGRITRQTTKTGEVRGQIQMTVYNLRTGTNLGIAQNMPGDRHAPKHLVSGSLIEGESYF